MATRSSTTWTNWRDFQRVRRAFFDLSSSPVQRLRTVREWRPPATEFVSPNNDTLYMGAAVDVGNGPVVLSVPDTDGRYYVLQFIDAWSNNFASVGRRATGTEAGTFLLVPAGYDGPVPAGMSVIEAPSRVFCIICRLQVDGQDDLPAVTVLQDQFDLSPLDPSPGPVDGIPTPSAGVADDLLFWEKFRVALAAFPPPEGDNEAVKLAASIGLTDAESPYVDPDPDLHDLLVEAEKQAKALLEELSRTVLTMVDGWASGKHAFDYNVDRLGPGTLDAPEWKIADRKLAYGTRAMAARMGLWGDQATRQTTKCSGKTVTGSFLTVPTPTN